MRLRRSALVMVCLLVATSAPAQVPAPALQDEAVRWLQSYIRVDTINPPGNEAAGVRFFKAILFAVGTGRELIPVELTVTRVPDSDPVLFAGLVRRRSGDAEGGSQA